MLTLFSFIALSASLAAASSPISGTIVDGSAEMARIVGPNGIYSSAVVLRNETFQFHSTIPAGVYSLFIESKTHIYPMYRLQVDASSQLKSASFVLPGVEYDKPTPIAFELPLQIQSVGTKDYFTPRESISLIGLLMNPMVLMMGLPLLMIFLMPKMMASIDPETMKEFRQTQAETQRLQQSASGEELTSRLASMLSGSSSNK